MSESLCPSIQVTRHTISINGCKVRKSWQCNYSYRAAYISVPFKDAFAFLVVILFLIVRPQGIFGERVAEKA